MPVRQTTSSLLAVMIPAAGGAPSGGRCLDGSGAAVSRAVIRTLAAGRPQRHRDQVGGQLGINAWRFLAVFPGGVGYGLEAR
jgi:acyl dehydratase